MKYISTRGGISPISFREAAMMGLATDGGLLLPEYLPRLDAAAAEKWRRLSYRELAMEVFSRFIADLPAADLRELITRSYAGFSHPEITPLVQQGKVHILELFHGPTLAFKDVALQFLGNFFEYQLRETGGRMNILGATSGDTGSAAIYGVRGKERINIFILHPYKRVSPVQELQMTTVTDSNVFNLAVQGTFDDGQAIVKSIFNDLAFKEKYHLGAVNSINWARILAQVVYYAYAFFRTGAEQVDFSVPTGNFGDIFAGYVARRLLPAGAIRHLVLATNENDLLTRFVDQGDYSLGTVVHTSSPSMDIQVASNFERYLFYLYGMDPGRVKGSMADFGRTGRLLFPEPLRRRIRDDFRAKAVSETETLETIRSFQTETGYLLDPHTAVGVNAGLRHLEMGVPMICLATAHPAKFAEAVTRATGRPPAMPASLSGLDRLESRCEILPAEIETIKKFIEKHGG